MLQRAVEFPDECLLKETHTLATLAARVVRIDRARRNSANDPKLEEFAVRTARRIFQQIISETGKLQTLMRQRQSERLKVETPPSGDVSTQLPLECAAPANIDSPRNEPEVQSAQPLAPPSIPENTTIEGVITLPKTSSKPLFTKIMREIECFCQNHVTHAQPISRACTLQTLPSYFKRPNSVRGPPSCCRIDSPNALSKQDLAPYCPMADLSFFLEYHNDETATRR